MPKYKVTVSDEVVYKRCATITVEAENEDAAKEDALQFAIVGDLSDDWDEEQIHAEPYEVTDVEEIEDGK